MKNSAWRGKCQILGFVAAFMTAGMGSALASDTCMPDTMANYMDNDVSCTLGDATTTVTLSGFYFTNSNVSGTEAVSANNILLTPSFTDSGSTQLVNVVFSAMNGAVFEASGNAENQYTFDYTVDPPPPLIYGQGFDLGGDPGETFITEDLCLGGINEPGYAAAGGFNCVSGDSEDPMADTAAPMDDTLFPTTISTLGVHIVLDLQGQGGYTGLTDLEEDTMVEEAQAPEPAGLGAFGLAALLGFGWRRKIRLHRRFPCLW